MKKLITLCTILILSITMVGCSKFTLSPEKATDLYLKEYKNSHNLLDVEELVKDYILDEESDLIKDSDSESFRLIIKDIIFPILESLEYEIGESTIDGNTSTVKVKVTALDLKPFIPEILENCLEEFMLVYLEDETYSEEEFVEIFFKGIANKLKSNTIKKSTSEITIGLIKDGVQWVVNEDDAFADIISGFLHEITPELFDAATENYIKKHMNDIDLSNLTE
ncbi:hypothetical protein [Clostridium sp. Marseille-Q7071]